jgi:hypothetical protein
MFQTSYKEGQIDGCQQHRMLSDRACSNLPARHGRDSFSMVSRRVRSIPTSVRMNVVSHTSPRANIYSILLAELLFTTLTIKMRLAPDSIFYIRTVEQSIPSSSAVLRTVLSIICVTKPLWREVGHKHESGMLAGWQEPVGLPV